MDVFGSDRLRFVLSGPPGLALRTLAEAEVRTVAVREPSLEEVFLDFYDGQRAL